MSENVNQCSYYLNHLTTHYPWLPLVSLTHHWYLSTRNWDGKHTTTLTGSYLPYNYYVYFYSLFKNLVLENLSLSPTLCLVFSSVSGNHFRLCEVGKLSSFRSLLSTVTSIQRCKLESFYWLKRRYRKQRSYFMLFSSTIFSLPTPPVQPSNSRLPFDFISIDLHSSEMMNLVYDTKSPL